MDFDGQTFVIENHTVEQFLYTVEGGFASPNFQLGHFFPTGEGRDQSTQAQNMIEVGMGEQDFVEALEANTTAKDLTLRAFTAIHEKTVFTSQNDLGGQAAMNRGRRGGCSEKDNFKHVVVSF